MLHLTGMGKDRGVGDAKLLEKRGRRKNTDIN